MSFIPHMKQFNKTISIEVSVDSIANMLLSNMKEDFKHKDIVVEAIIGAGVEKGGLSYVYNALAGFSNAINFAVGEMVVCKETAYVYQHNQEKIQRSPRVIGDAKVIEINEFADRKVRVEFIGINSNGEPTTYEEWVSHTSCDKTA
jgi:hypothetical protein